MRPAGVDDVDFLLAAHAADHARDFVLTPTAERVRAALDEPGFETRIIVDASGDAGMLLLSYDPDDPWIVEFRRIIVTRPGRGIGRAAIDWVVAHAFDDLGAHRLWLEAVADNARARRLYEAAGFRLEGTWRDGYPKADGRYVDLCAYGMLATDPR